MATRSGSRWTPPGAGALFWLTLLTLGIYGVVYMARRWQELASEIADIKEDLAQMRTIHSQG